MKKLPLIYPSQESLSAHGASSDKNFTLPETNIQTALQRKPIVPVQKSRLARRGAI
jgi:hypothetical protein